VLVGVALAAPPAGAAAPPASGLFQSVAPGFETATLSRDTTDSFRLTAANGTVSVSATATNTGGNGRGVFWPTGQVPVAKQQSCVTLTARHGTLVQQGIALRIKPLKSGRLRAITVTTNIYPNGWGLSIFNVHVWHTGRHPAFRQAGTFDLRNAFAEQGRPIPFPWRLCARVQGRLLMFQAWPEGRPKPAWSTTSNGGSLKLPGGTGYAGQAGWYIGHLFAGDSGSFARPEAGSPTVAPS
jgi:hypothetical protein